MATRFYFPSSAVAPASPAYSAAWDDTSVAVRVKTVTTRLSTFILSKAFADSDNTDKDILFIQYVSAPLAAQTISAQTIKFQMRGYELSSNNNLYFAITIRSWNGSSFQTLLALTRDDTELATSFTNRSFTATTSAVTVGEGDYLVIEIGVGGDPGPPADHDSQISVGDNASTDLPEDDTETSVYNPWLEFPNTISFAGGDRNINVSDGVTVGESATVTTSDLSINVSDGLVIGESTNLEVYIYHETLRIDAKPSGDINIDLIYGDFSQFTSVVNGGGTISSSAALGDTNYGLEANASYGSVQYGLYTLDTPDTSGILRARAYIDRNTIAITTVFHNISVFNIKNSSDELIASIQIRKHSDSTIRVYSAFIDDAGVPATVMVREITPGTEYCVELEVKRATSDVAGDGYISAWLDGTFIGTITGDNYDRFSDVKYITVGRDTTSATVTGIAYVDEIVVRFDNSEIGTNKENVDIGESVTVVLGAAADLDIDVQDDVTVGEISNVVISDLSITKTDAIILGDTPDLVHEECFTEVSDAVSVGDTPSVDLEAAADLSVSKQDDVALGETVDVVTSDLSIGTADNLTVGEVSDISISDIEIDESDNIVLGDNASLENNECYLSVSDGLSIGDVPEVSVSSAEDLSVNRQDDLTIGYSIALEVSDLEIDKQDSLTIGESKDVAIANLVAGAADAIVLGEETDLLLPELYQTSSDGVVLGDAVIITVSDLVVAVADGLTIGEDPEVILQAAGDLVISEQDSITIGEVVAAKNAECYTETSDGVLLLDSIAVTVSGLELSVSDALLIGDVPSVEFGALAISAQDNIIVDDSTDAEVSACIVEVSDDLTVGETATQEIGVETSVEDAVVMGEQISLEVTTLILEVSDDLDLSDVPAVSLPEPGALVIQSSDNVAIGEPLTVSVSDLVFAVVDGCVVGEDTNVVFQVEDLSVAITPETTWASGVRIYP